MNYITILIKFRPHDIRAGQFINHLANNPAMQKDYSSVKFWRTASNGTAIEVVIDKQNESIQTSARGFGAFSVTEGTHAENNPKPRK